MALRTRLALLFAAAMAALAAAGGWMLVRELDASTNAALDVALSVRADALAQQVAPDGSVRDFQDGSGGNAVPLPASRAVAQVIGPGGTAVESSEGAGARLLLSQQQVSAARKGPLAVSSALPDGAPVRLVAVPVADTGGRTVVVVGASREVAVAATSRVLTALWTGGPVLVVLGGFGAWLVAGAVLRPVERMRREADAISAGDTEARLAVPRRRDEIARLGATMNALLDRLQRALAQQRAFVADAGHELRTPLTMLRAELELAGRPQRDRASLQAAVRAAAGDTDRLIRLAEDLLTLARAEGTLPLVVKPVRLDVLAAEAVQAARPAAAGANVVLEAAADGPVTVLGDRDRLRQVADNLLDNAVRYAPPGSTVHAVVGCAEGAGVLRVLDRGSGFPAGFLPRAFDRFSRADSGRADGAGTGLGLAIVAAIVHTHAGTVRAADRAGGGAEVAVSIPACPPDEARVAPHRM
ncbi:HAMP domain-containing sensor histidine kinase [Amycolatopsis sp. La24]|uniref:sensor histidine kinase n=1 Tax=Amycolatopsis sp. La24 TaxID=3028304 RepID=UPI0023B19724|nr:HAMP domain-containing sensor histidine kinase [Amycolatopsis sp. La24]